MEIKSIGNTIGKRIDKRFLSYRGLRKSCDRRHQRSRQDYPAQDHHRIELAAGSGFHVSFRLTDRGLKIENFLFDSEQLVKDRVLAVHSLMLRQIAKALALCECHTSRVGREFAGDDPEQGSLVNGYACKSEITGILKGLGFQEDEFGKKVELSIREIDKLRCVSYFSTAPYLL